MTHSDDRPERPGQDRPERPGQGRPDRPGGRPDVGSGNFGSGSEFNYAVV